VPNRPFKVAAPSEHPNSIREIGCADPTPKPRVKKPGASHKTPLRAVVRVPNNLPVTQVEIEVIASLLDDWESLFPIATEVAE
jgi:hypothetical protein